MKRSFILSGLVFFMTFIILIPAVQAQRQTKQWVPLIEGSLPGPPVINIEEGTDSVRINCHIQGYYQETVIREGKIFLRISLPGCAENGEVGQPALSLKMSFLEIPYGVDLDLNNLQSRPIVEQLAYPILPEQPPELDIDGPSPPFTMDERFYATDTWVPDSVAQIVEIGFMRGQRFASVRLSPFKYNPGKNVMEIHSNITFTLQYKGEQDPDQQTKQERLYSPFYESLAENALLNFQKLHDKDGGDFIYKAADYLIIVPETLYNNSVIAGNNKINEFADWKRTKGYIVTIVIIPDSTTPNDIKSIIQPAYYEWFIPPTYVLLIGDSNHVPCVAMPYVPDLTEPYGTDFPYTLLSGADYVPDILLGRISVENGTQCIDVLNKILAYDQLSMAYHDWLPNALLLAYFQDIDADSIADRFYVDTISYIHHSFFNIIGTDVQTVLSTNHFAGTYHPRDSTYVCQPKIKDPLPYTDSDFIASSDTSAQKTAISSAINSGVGLVIHRNHGTGYGDQTYWSQPYFNNYDVNNLSNGSMTPFVLSINCGTGKFRDNTSIAETLTRKQDGGAVGVIAPAGNTWGYYNEPLLQGAIDSIWPWFDAGYANTLDRRMGQMLNIMKMYLFNCKGNSPETRMHFHKYLLFGDPELEFRTGAVNRYKPGIYKPGNFEVEINIPEPSPLAMYEIKGPPDGAIVAISQRDALGNIRALGQAIAKDRTAVVHLHTPVDEEIGEVILCVTNNDMVPYIAKLPLVSQLKGDVDGNGLVDILDALLIARYYVGFPVSQFNKDMADVNADSTIDIIDALLVAQYYVGLIMEL